MTTIGILGGGLSGLALKRSLPNSEVLEAEEVPGGLCRSFRVCGHWYDLGGHILFSKNTELLLQIEEILKDSAVQHVRRNFILFGKRFIRYPFENGLPDLPISDRIACLWHYVRRTREKPANFGEWILARFGRGFAERYLTPYNDKIWKTPLADISTGWVDRIPDPPLIDIVKGAIGINTEGYLHQLRFIYPQSGGIQTLTDALAGTGEGIRCAFRISRIIRDGDGWIVSDGKRELRYDKILSTIPAPDVISAMPDAPQEVRAAAAGLRFNSLITVMVVTSRIAPFDRLAVFVPQRRLIFHRVYFPSFLSHARDAVRGESMVAEITVPPLDSLLWKPDEDITARVTDHLSQSGLLKKCDIVCTEVRRVPYAYVIDLHDRQRRMGIIRSYLRKQGIEICGRFAEFEYLNMDACIARARKLARDQLCQK